MEGEKKYWSQACVHWTISCFPFFSEAYILQVLKTLLMKLWVQEGGNFCSNMYLKHKENCNNIVNRATARRGATGEGGRELSYP